MIQDLIPFSPGSGLNYDDDLSVMPKGDGKYRLNVSLDEGEHGGVLSKSKGNAILRNIIMPMVTVYAASKSIQTSPTRTRFTILLIPDSDVSSASTYGGFILSIRTSQGSYNIFNKAANNSTVANGRSVVLNKITNLEDPYIYSATFVASSAGRNTITIDILATSEVAEVNFVTVLIGDPVYDSYFTGKEIVGSYYHQKDDELYTFWAAHSGSGVGVYNDNLIMVYKYRDDITLILNSAYMTIPSTIATWSKKQPITAVVIGDENNKILYWSNEVNPPMNIDVNRAINTTYSLAGDQYSNHSTDTLRKMALNLIKKQPDYALSMSYGDNVSEVDTVLAKTGVQFIYRYIFRDNSKSAWSIVSSVYLKTSYDDALGVQYPYLPCYEVSLSTVIDSSEISKVQFAYRTQNVDRWKLFKTEDYTRTAMSIDFKDIGETEILDEEETNKLYDNVPVKSGVLSSINDNRILLGDNTVGFDNVPLTATLTPMTYHPGTVQNSGIEASATVSPTVKDIDVSSSGYTVYVVITTINKKHVIKLEDYYMSAADIANYFVNYINNNIVPIDSAIVSAANVSNYVRITHVAGQWVDGYRVGYLSYQRRTTLKNGITHHLGIVYYDEFGRRGYVNKIDGKYINFLTEQSTHSDNEYLDFLKLEVNNQPPIWAHYWGIHYGDNNPAYTQLAIRVADLERENGVLKIKIDSILNDVRELNPGFNLSYQYTPGDRIRWIGCINDYSYGGVIIKKVALLPDYIDKPILGYSGDFNEFILTEDYSRSEDSRALIDAGTYVLIEIYSPNPQNSPTFYFETPYKFPVINPGTNTCYHGVVSIQASLYGNTAQDQTASVPAICYFAAMDYRLFQHWTFDTSNHCASFIDSQSFSNYFKSKLRNYGKPHIVNPDGRRIRLNSIQWGGLLIPNTRVNGLSKFGFTDEKLMDDKFGAVTGLVVTGDVLNVIQQSKVSTIYLGAELAKDAAGREILSYSNIILGSSRPTLEDFGSSHKQSIQRSGNYVYGWDSEAGVVWRKAYDGISEISAYKMKEYFRAKAETLKASGSENIIVVGGFDSFKKVYYLTFIDLYNSANNETLAFHEPTNRWTSFYSFIPDMYGSLGNTKFLTFKNGFMYDQESATATVNNFFGTQYGSKVWAVGNNSPFRVNTYLGIAEIASEVWDMPDDTDIIIDADMIELSDSIDYTKKKGSMTSRLKTKRFRYKQGRHEAALLRDMNTSVAANQYDLFSGRQLKGKTILLKLNNSTVNAGYLRAIVVTYR